MIPLRLQIKNFLSYGSELQTIDFANYPLICLSGKNGHGKSALLDAITWAVWGRARKVLSSSKADEGLLRLGQTQMLVCLDFTFNNKHFRIRREFAVTYGKPYAVLEFGILEQTTNTYTPLTDKTIKATQEKIESMIGLDYESFVNSAFLRQGQSNEFSQKSPKDRKEILANILGLARFETLRKKAVEKTKDIILKKDHLLGLNERIVTELGQASILTEQAAHINQQLAHLCNQELTVTEQSELHVQEKQKLDDQLRELEFVKFKLDSLIVQEKELLFKLITTRNDWKLVHYQHLTMPDVASLQLVKQQLSAELADQQQRLHNNLSLKEKLLKLKQQEQDLIVQAEKKFMAELHDKKMNHEKIKSVIGISQHKMQEIHKHQQLLNQEITTINQQIAELSNKLILGEPIKKRVAIEEQQFEKRKSFYQKYGAHLNFLKTELQQLDQKQQFSHDDSNPSCPLCEQNLSASRKKFLKTKFAKQEQHVHHKYARLTTMLAQLKKILIEQHSQLTDLKKQVGDLNTHALTIQDLERHKAKLLAQQQEYSPVIEKLVKDMQMMKLQEHELNSAIINHEQQHRLTSREHMTISHEISVLELQIKDVGYDAQRHQEVTAQHNALEQQITGYNNAREALVLQHQKRADIKSCRVTLKEIRKNKKDLDVQLDKFGNIQEQRNALAHAQQQLTEQSEKIWYCKARTVPRKGKIRKLAESIS